MKDIFWNIRGMGKTGKKQCLIDLIKEHDLDFLGVQETKLEQFSCNLLEALAGSRQFCSYKRINWRYPIRSE
jgi:exonuclease III